MISPLRISTTISLLLIFCSLGYSQEEDSLKKQKSFAMYPVFAYRPLTNAQFGAVAIWFLNDRDTSQSDYQRESVIAPFFIYTLNKQILSTVKLNYFFKSGLNLNASIKYYDFPDVFYGIGNNNNRFVSESYVDKYWELEGRVFFPLNVKTFVGLAFDIQNNGLSKLVPGGMIESELVNGIEGGTYVAIGPTIKWDTRNSSTYPTLGSMVSAQVIPTVFGDYSFIASSFKFVKYMRIKNENNIIAVNFKGSLTSGNDAPFYKLPRLGGSHRLRGISNANLYRDKQLLYSQVEYRKHLFWKLGLVVFLGVGEVAQEFRDFNLTEFKFVGGLGARYTVLKDKNLRVRFDVGFAEGGQSAFYLGIQESF